MKDELNSYGITNADGVSAPAENEGKVSFDNDKRGFISESVTSEQDETAHVSESFDDPSARSEDDSPRYDSNTDLSSASSSASTTASASTSAASAASASVGGGLGALAGVVGTSVVAAVVVVATFVSTLAITLSLVLANMFSLTFEVTMTGADEKDFETPIYAVLTGENVYMEQEVKADTTLLTFDDLEPGKEYRLTVKNQEKVFAEVTAFTATEPVDRGELVSSLNGKDVSVTVTRVELKATEYYTLIAKDAKGNVVYKKDGMEAPAEYTFTLDKEKDVYFYLMVNGKTYAFSQALTPSYDLDNGVWNWSDDRLSATAAFPDVRGGHEDLVLNATVTSKTTEPKCLEDGSVVYTAKVEYQGKSVTKKETVVLTAVGHDYEIISDGENGTTYVCSQCGDTYTDND